MCSGMIVLADRNFELIAKIRQFIVGAPATGRTPARSGATPIRRRAWANAEAVGGRFAPGHLGELNGHDGPIGPNPELGPCGVHRRSIPGGAHRGPDRDPGRHRCGRDRGAGDPARGHPRTGRDLVGLPMYFAKLTQAGIGPVADPAAAALAVMNGVAPIETMILGVVAAVVLPAPTRR